MRGGNIPLPDSGPVHDPPVPSGRDAAGLSRPIADACHSLPTTTCAASSAEYDCAASQCRSSAHALRRAAAMEREAQAEAEEKASFNLIPITHNIKGFYVQICRRGSPGGEI